MSWLGLTVIGGLVGADATSFPQAMLSRPLVAGALAGLVFGAPAHGVLVGAILEIFALVILPFGAARYPESGTGAAAAAAAYSHTATTALDPQLLLLAVVFGLAWEQVAGASVVMIRRINERLVAGVMTARKPSSFVARRHLLALAIDALRGALVVLVGAIVGLLLLRAFRPLIALNASISAGLLIIASMAMLGAVLPLFGGLREWRFAYGAGIACGLLLLLL